MCRVMRVSSQMLAVCGTIAILLGQQASMAKCLGESVEVWPAPGAIPPNAHLLVELYGNYQHLAPDVKKCDLVMVARDHEVCLVPIESHTGDYRISQIVLKPESLLVPNTQYRIETRDSTFPAHGDWAIHGGKPLEWSVTNEVDVIPPHWLDPPRLVETFYSSEACAPASGAVIEVNLRESTTVLAKVRLMRPEGHHKATEYVLPIRSNHRLLVGHRGCSGAFTLSPGARYRVTIAALDVGWNSSAPDRATIEFVAPFPPSHYE
jgi:hypothetical protein